MTIILKNNIILLFKLSCLRAGKEGITLDIELTKRIKRFLEVNNKIETLSKLMPLNLGKVLRTRPAIRQDMESLFTRK